MDYIQLNTLTEKGEFWVTRSKSNMKVKVISSRVNDSRNAPQRDKKDHYSELTGKISHARYPKRFRHVVAKVLDSEGREVTVSFLSNNMDWEASGICELYRCRWGIETFFKENKQTLQISTFIGFSRNAIEWQI